MKHVWISTLTILVLSGAARTSAQPSTAPTQTGPRLELSSDKLDFGEIWQGQPARGEFTVRNTGTQPLTITVKTSCGCTVSTQPKSPLAPGESDVFTISYDTLKRTGRARQRVTLRTNDPTQPSRTIQVLGFVKPLYDATPREGLIFHRLTRESRVRKSMRFKIRYDRPLHLKLKEGQDFGPFRIELKTIEPGKEYELTAETVPPLTEEISRVRVALETGLPEPPEIHVPVHALVQPDVTCRTSLLRVARQSIVPVEQRVALEFRADKPVRVTAVQPSSDAVRYEILEPRPLRGAEGWMEQVIRVTLPPGDQLPPGNGQLVILTDSSDPRYAKFTIPIEVVERPRRVRRPHAPGRTPPPEKPEQP